MPVWNKAKRRKFKLLEPEDKTVFSMITDTHMYESVDGDPESEEGLGAIYMNWYLYAGSAKLKHFVDETNALQPDLVVHLGDMIQSGSDKTWDLVMENWSKINAPTEMLIGNHELGHEGGYDRVVQRVNYENRDPIARSVFNKSLAVNNIRVIIMDTTIGNSGEHEPSGTGFFQSDALEWLESELNSCKEKNVLVFSHHGPHLHSADKFDKNQAYEYRDILKNVQKTRGLNINTIFGHHHPVKIEMFDTLEGINAGYCLGANLLYNPGPYYTLEVNQKGELIFKEHMVGYPYP